jgi:hypothetical protein
MTQPGVYYLLRPPFADVVALCADIAEGPGSRRERIRGAPGGTT